MQASCHTRRNVLIATGALCLSMAVPTYAVDDRGPVAQIHVLINGLVRVMKAGAKTPFTQRFDMLAPVIDQTFDLQAILQQSVGLSWESLPPDQKEMLAQAFRSYTVASYVDSFNYFNNQKFEVSPETRAVGNEQVVTTRIIPLSGTTHELDYVMRKVGADWRVVDVLADGSISRVAVQRSDFRHLLGRGGAEALASNLKRKFTDLSDGSS